MDKKLLFIYNTFAGKSKIKSKMSEVIDIFVKNGYEVTMHPTQGSKDAVWVAKNKASEYDLIVCSGGDGTLDEVVTGIVQSETKIPIGYLPTGSTNDFANSLSIPKDIMKAAEVATAGKEFNCDVGQFNEDSFVYIAAFGIFTEVSYTTKQEVKNVLGHMAYILEGAKSIYNIKSYNLKVWYEDTFIEDDFIFGMITNSLSVGGFKNITGKNVLLDDGLLEVTLVKNPKNPVEIQGILTSLLKKEMDPRYMYSFKTDTLKIESDVEVPWTLDGEFGGNHNLINISNNKKAIQIMIDDK